jgi:hypothetical protein
MSKQTLISQLKEIMDESQDYIIMEFDSAKNYFVQFIKNNKLLHAEAVSNEYLEDSFKLNEEQLKKLINFGWKQTQKDENFSKDFQTENDADFEIVADSVFNIISEVYQIQNPTIKFTD